jgi:Polysaccharide pyruvyl transferase
VPRSDWPLYAGKARRFFEAFQKLPLSRRFSLEQPDEIEGFDLVIVGSDEVWNLRHPWYGGRAIFYGAGLRAGRLVSYAASFGNHDASDGLDGWWAGKLRDFAAISVRDENSRTLVRGALGTEPDLVLDPCLQFPRVIGACKATPDAPYAVVYGHGFPDWFKQAARRWADARRYRLVSIGYRNDWADEQRITADPEEFAGLMAGAAAVATNFFHGCVFALLNTKPFACPPSSYRSNKVRDLTQALGAGKHLVADGAGDFEPAMDEPPTPAILGRIAELRQRSDRYLDHALA